MRGRLPPVLAAMLLSSASCLYCGAGIGPLTPSVGCVEVVDFLMFAGVPAIAAMFVAATAVTRSGRIAAFALGVWFVMVPSLLLVMLGCAAPCTTDETRPLERETCERAASSDPLVLRW